MAKSKKLKNFDAKRYQKKGKRRRVAVRTKRMYYLIVCEGEKTEPNYFEAFKRSLPKGVLELANIDIDGTGKNTLGIIEEAQQLRDLYEKRYQRIMDHVWAVFDKDDFPDQNFNNAIHKGKASDPQIHCAWTNEAFELWYLLHFHYYNTGISRKQYANLIERAIHKAAGSKKFKYKKNSKDMHALLDQYGNQAQAIEYAKKLEQLYEDQQYAKHNPCTKVHHLIQALIDLADQYRKG